MRNIRHILHTLLIMYLNISTFIGFMFLTGIIFLCIYLCFIEPDFLNIDSCLDRGYVWDYKQKICRDDCLTWNDKVECVPITEENIENKSK